MATWRIRRRAYPDRSGTGKSEHSSLDVSEAPQPFLDLLVHRRRHRCGQRGGLLLLVGGDDAWRMRAQKVRRDRIAHERALHVLRDRQTEEVEHRRRDVEDRYSP